MSEFCDVNLSIVNNVWIKQLHFREKGWMMQTHAHVFDHQTLLATGRVRVTVDGSGTTGTYDPVFNAVDTGGGSYDYLRPSAGTSTVYGGY